jgi:hypothetical protein
MEAVYDRRTSQISQRSVGYPPRYREVEIMHGRFAQLAVIGMLTT